MAFYTSFLVKIIFFPEVNQHLGVLALGILHMKAVFQVFFHVGAFSSFPFVMEKDVNLLKNMISTREQHVQRPFAGKNMQLFTLKGEKILSPL